MIRLTSPQNLYYTLLCAGILLIFLIWSERAYRRQSDIFAKPRTLKLMNPYLDFRHPALHICLVTASVVLIGLALSRPQWGIYWAGERDKGRDIVIAVDLSKSMASQDSSPDRITRAKDEIANFAGRAKGDRLALIGFSGDAFLFCPLTMNRDTFQRSLDGIGIGSVKRGGTSYYNLVMEAARSFKAAAVKTKTLVVISDGDDTIGSLDKAIELAKKEDITIYSVGLGTAAGGFIPIVGKDVRAVLSRMRRALLFLRD
ncbi:MAG: VWA domain-containing protein [Candidatus Omnitrophica bacterium]|nr:VWA domain-containing protein [Candidatus Omnitrophota bacterium]